jgi:hypothetical protein
VGESWGVSEGVEGTSPDQLPAEVWLAVECGTVADWFKYRRKIGLDVALEALADA